MVATCPSENTVETDQTSFFSPGTIHWDAHRIGWVIAGGCTVVTLIISAISVLLHCRNYTNPKQQRQILRILYMPPVYAVISFLSYRFFRDYTYYSLAQVIYEAFTISAFLLLLIEYFAESAPGHMAENAIARKDKRRLDCPFCCWRYRPTKAYFMHTVKWLVMQYCILRPAVSIAGIVCEAFNVLCGSSSINFHFANVYLKAVAIVSSNVCSYGLGLFNGLTKEELQGHRPLGKFWSIKLIINFTENQSFVLTVLGGRIIHATKYWTTTNIANGLNALAVCIEMIFFSALMMWAFTYKEYKRKEGVPATSIFRPLWDSINYADFAVEIYGSLRYFFGGGSGHPDPNRVDFGQAFGVSSSVKKRPSNGDNIDLSRVVSS